MWPRFLCLAAGSSRWVSQIKARCYSIFYLRIFNYSMVYNTRKTQYRISLIVDGVVGYHWKLGRRFYGWFQRAGRLTVPFPLAINGKLINWLGLEIGFDCIIFKREGLPLFSGVTRALLRRRSSKTKGILRAVKCRKYGTLAP